MPKMNGMLLARDAKEEKLVEKIILVTGARESAALKRSFDIILYKLLLEPAIQPALLPLFC